MKKKSTWFILGGGVLIGILFIFLERWLHLSKTTILLLFVLLWFVLMAGLLVYRSRVSKKVNQEAAEIFPLLFEKGDPDAYIEKMAAFLQKQKEPYFEELCRINLALGYSCKGEHEKALEILYTVDQKRVKSIHLAIVYNNIVMEHFFQGNYQEAMESLKRYRQVLTKYEKNFKIAQNIRELFCAEDYITHRPQEDALPSYFMEKKKEFENLQVFNSFCYFVALDQLRQKNKKGAALCVEEMEKNEPVMEIQLRLRTIKKELSAREV